MLQTKTLLTEFDFLAQSQAALERKRGQLERQENPAIPRVEQAKIPHQRPASSFFSEAMRKLLSAGQLKPAQLSFELPICPLCGATAWNGPYRTATDISHDCNCVDSARSSYESALRRLWVQEKALEHYLLSVPARFQSAALENIQQGSASNQTVLSHAIQFSPSSIWFLWGMGGVGKTNLAIATGRYLAEQRHSTRYISALDWANTLRSAVANPLEFSKPNLESPQVLIIDEIDKMKPTEFIFQEFHSLADYRLRENKATIYIANHDPAHCAKYLALGDAQNTTALHSRFVAGKVHMLAGKDRREGSAI